MNKEESNQAKPRSFTEGREKGNLRFITSSKPVIKGNLWEFLKEDTNSNVSNNNKK